MQQCLRPDPSRPDHPEGQIKHLAATDLDPLVWFDHVFCRMQNVSSAMRRSFLPRLDGGKSIQWNDICSRIMVVGLLHGRRQPEFSSNGTHSKPTEITKRTAIFTAIGQLGSMFAGIMMTAMYKTMEGNSGLRGWQWVFIIGTSVHTLSALEPLTITSEMVSWEYRLAYSVL